MEDSKILFDGRFLSLSHAGIGRYSCEILKNLLPLDPKQKFIVLLMRGSKLDKALSAAMFERDNPVEIIEVDERHYSLGEQTTFLRLLNGLKPDLVHFPHFNHPIFYRGKFVVTIHDLTLSEYAERGGFYKRRLYKYVIARAARNSQRVLTVSEYVKKILSKEFDLEAGKVVVTYNGIDGIFKKVTSPQALKKAEKYGLKKPYILSVGQWRAHKNLLRLVDAYELIQKEPEWQGKIDLVFAGKVDSKYPQLRRRVQELGLTGSAKFIGFVEDADLPIIYNNAAVFVFPSFSEGFGLPGLEAQACGVPTVASERSCLPEILGEGALYFNPENSKEMAKKIKTVLEDKKIRESLVSKGEQNTKRFSWRDSAQKTLEVYREILYKVKS